MMSVNITNEIFETRLEEMESGDFDEEWDLDLEIEKAKQATGRE